MFLKMLFLFLLISNPILGVKNKAHFVQITLISEDDFTETEPSITKSNFASCSLKCTQSMFKCMAFKFDEDTRECSLGKIDPGKAVCSGSVKVHAKSTLFEPHSVPHFMLFRIHSSGKEGYHYAPTIESSLEFLPHYDDSGLKTPLKKYNKFYSRGKIHFCYESHLGYDNHPCRSWDIYTGEWTEMPNKPLQRANSPWITTFPSGAVVISGGTHLETLTNINELYNPDDQTWTEIEPLNEPASGMCGVALSNETFLIMSGKAQDDTMITDTWLFDLSTNTKEQKKSHPETKTNPSCAKMGKFVFLISDKLYVYNLEKDEWDTKDEWDPWADVRKAVAFSNEGSLYYTGGISMSNKVFQWNDQKMIWEHIGQAPISTAEQNFIVPYTRSFKKPKC